MIEVLTNAVRCATCGEVVARSASVADKTRHAEGRCSRLAPIGALPAKRPAEYASPLMDGGFIADTIFPVVGPTPAPPPQQWAHRDLAERHRLGDFEPDGARVKPGLAGFLASMAQSHDYGVPVRSSAAGWEAHAQGNGAIGTSGFNRPPDSMTFREEASLAVRELARIAEGLPVATVASGYVFDAASQMRLWTECHGPGALTWRPIKGGPERRVPGMGTVPASPIVRIPERRKRDATELHEEFARADIVVTAHEIGLMCRRITRLVEAAFIARGWVRAKRVSIKVNVDTEASMAKVAGYDLSGWKEIAPLCGDKSAETCRGYASREVDPLPVYDGLGGEVLAKSAEVTAWVARQVQPRRRSA